MKLCYIFLSGACFIESKKTITAHLTGDGSLIGLYVYLLAVCLAGIAAVMMHRRKKDTIS